MTAAKKSPPPPPDATCQRGHLNAGKPKQKTKTKTKHTKKPNPLVTIKLLIMPFGLPPIIKC